MSTRKIELSVGAVKYADPNEIFTEEELNNIKNKVPELDEKVGVIDDDIKEINSSLDNKASKNEFTNKTLEIDNRINSLVIPISPENVNIEVTDSHNSATKVTTFDSLKQRLDQFDFMQDYLIENIQLNKVTFDSGFLHESMTYYPSENRKSTKIFSVSYGDIISLGEKDANIKWKLILFSSTSISSDSLLHYGGFSEYSDFKNYIVNDKNIKGAVITIGKKDDSNFTGSDIDDITSKINIINIKKKDIIDYNNLNDLLFENKIYKPLMKIGVYESGTFYFHQDVKNRMGSNLITVKNGDKILFEPNTSYEWKISTFNSNTTSNSSTVINEYTYTDFRGKNKFLINDKNIKGILIQGRNHSNLDLTSDDLASFSELISIVSINIRSDLTNSNSQSYIRIGSYNIGHFCEGTSSVPSGTDAQKIDFRNCLANMKCNVVALQENDTFYNQTTSETPYEAIYKNYKYYSCGTKYDYNCNAFISDYEIKNRYEKIFDNNYSQNRYYYSCDISIDGKDVHLITTQLEFQDVTTRRKQISEIIEEAKKYERCIICGDFNVSSRIDNVASEPYNALYEEDYKLFTDSGLSLVNTGYLGGMNTLVSREGSSDGIFPWDNIIVTDNIKIKNIGRIEMPYMRDHYPIFADLVIY